MFREFREFVKRGNVLDLAVGVVLGAAFTRIMNSLVSDIIMPPLGLLLGRFDFSSLYINLTDTRYESLAAAQEAGAATINYGLFANAVVTFLIVAFVLFLVVRAFNRMRRREEAAPPPPTAKQCPFCLSTIALEATRCPQCTTHLPAGR